ncbi:hypothetical protein PHYSODRAFT_488570 [Phytophthora sojae]|uniref:Uncharacterized protein n=1 Tax=Phytophthora sojae (strain P6497) TaxID=1094619 RepID=G4Z746_PHYSP|nr:hypothetical protein PHYSODRAFT_488570 [Phytophthora sojae]EGZ22430.1 hypothetical protein PHYSODRAFT_488570 [Phytophthora sojae]|eukprot:XP_009525147.1 hypothetical protein PHYSODRAFT_488570 [Phytophthora sojae]
MLLPILTSAQDVLEGGDLRFQRDSQPVAASSDRHASKLVRKRLKRRKQSYAAAVKTSIYGNYAASRASSRTESRFGGSKFGGSRASASLWGAVPKVPRMSLIYDLHRGGESLMNSSWIGSQQCSTGTASNNASWLPGAFSTTKSPSPPPSVAGTARVAVDFGELQQRADIERDLNTRESVRRSKDELNRKSDLRLKLRSLADPTVSLDKEEAMMTAFGARGSRSRLQHSRQGTRDGKRVGGTKSSKASTLAADETTTFRTEDYEGLTSDVVLCSKSGELLVGENCFVVEQKHRREFLLDLQTRGVVQPRIQLVATPKPDEEIVPDENVPSPGHQQPTRSSPPPLRPPGAPTSAEQLQISTPSDFDGQIGSFESSPCLALNLEATPLAKGVVIKLPDTGAARALATKTRNAPTKKSPKRAPLPESVSNAKLEKHFNALIQTPGANKPGLSTSQSDSVLQTQRALPTAAPLSTSPASAQPPQTTKPSGAGSPVLPKHIVRVTLLSM